MLKRSSNSFCNALRNVNYNARIRLVRNLDSGFGIRHKYVNAHLYRVLLTENCDCDIVIETIF